MKTTKVKKNKVAIEDIWVIPTNKIVGLRWGQLIYNAIAMKIETADKVVILDTLYEMDGDVLSETIDWYLKKYHKAKITKLIV